MLARSCAPTGCTAARSLCCCAPGSFPPWSPSRDVVARVARPVATGNTHPAAPAAGKLATHPRLHPGAAAGPGTAGLGGAEQASPCLAMGHTGHLAAAAVGTGGPAQTPP